MKTKLALTIGILCLFLAASPSFASIITIAVEGQITKITDPYNVLEGRFSEGLVFTGYYSYDSSTQDSSSDTSEGIYYMVGQNCAFTFGDMTFTNNPNEYYQLSIQNNHLETDSYSLWTGYQPILHWNNNIYTTSGMISWGLYDDTAKVLSNDSLPITAPNLSDWKYNYFNLYYEYNEHVFEMFGTVTSAVVPEPVSLLMITMGGLLLIPKRSKIM